MADTYTVRKGDTLWKLAQTYNTTVDALVKLNNIKDPDYIVVGQVLKLSGTPDDVKTNTSTIARIDVYGLQSNTDRAMYVSWSFDKGNVDHYLVRWQYTMDVSGKVVTYKNDDQEIKVKQATYTAPENAITVKVSIKAVAKTHKVNGKDTPYFSSVWTTSKAYSFSNNPPSAPTSAPDVKIEGYNLTATMDGLEGLNATKLRFLVYKDNETTVFRQAEATISTGHASAQFKIAAGSVYKVRCLAIRGSLESGYSPYSENMGTIPATPTKFTRCEGRSTTSVYLEWDAVANAKTYDIEYATERGYFDISDQTTTISDLKETRYEKTGLETGDEYFFRVRARNDEGESGWSEISSAVIGKGPTAPTTWSSTTTAIAGEPLTLYWVHNSGDGSPQSKARLEITIGGTTQTYEWEYTVDKDDDRNLTRHYDGIDTGIYPEGTKIKWRVATAGATGVYGDWSIERIVDIYAPPTLELTVTDYSGNTLTTLNSFPFTVKALAGPKTQAPTGFYLSVIARSEDDFYEIVDDTGSVKMVNNGDEVYSKYFDISGQLEVELSAHDMTLENGVTYEVRCTVSMDSALTAENSKTFDVDWITEEYEPNAELSIDRDKYATYIRPYCEDISGKLIENVVLAVYRRDFDGEFVELGSNIVNTDRTFVTDPHPALDYARYRIVAKSLTTGAVSFYDLPDYPINGKAVVLTWDETWTTFQTVDDEDGIFMHSPVNGSMLVLPYNIDVSDSHQPDVELVEYIGRKHPVSYYGTQRGESASWSVTIDKNDTATLTVLRHLARWSGDVYVREPSGSGYWANIKISFSQKHGDLAVPVTIDVTRVEGGA
jgi:murein DD-endopeptidase MepM/ murein hydrolase activator NlpD